MRCDFCGKEIPTGTGILYVTKIGKKFYFCSGKCEKNKLKLNRNPRKVKWTEFSQKERKAQ